MYGYFETLLKKLLSEKYPHNSHTFNDNNTTESIDGRTITEEYRVFLDKVAIKMTFDTFEREEIIQAILKLTRLERIIIVFYIIQEMSLSEIALLIDASVDSVYTQKGTALK